MAMRTSSVFQPTLPLRGATRLAIAPRTPFSVSTHAPLAGSDARTRPRWTATASFNPRSPCGERPSRAPRTPWPSCFNPRSPCGERRCRRSGRCRPPGFNPRSPCRERLEFWVHKTDGTLFQPTLPLRGATLGTDLEDGAYMFQPTLPLRGATSRHTRPTRPSASFNPRSPCGERHGRRPLRRRGAVSTHAPLAGSDVGVLEDEHGRHVSTHAPLAGSDHQPCRMASGRSLVSTHAPLAGSDAI